MYEEKRKKCWINKSILIKTSAIISLVLFNVKEVNAEEKKLVITENIKTEEHQTKNNVKTNNSHLDNPKMTNESKDTPSNIPSTKPSEHLSYGNHDEKLNELYNHLNSILEKDLVESFTDTINKNDEISKLLTEAFIAHRSNFYEDASTLYNKLIHNYNLEEEIKLVIEELKEYSDLTIGLSEKVTEKNIHSIEESNEEQPRISMSKLPGKTSRNSAKAELNNENLEQSDKTIASQSELRVLKVSQSTPTANQLYTQAMTARGASPAWAAAQDLKTYFPNDLRVSEAINTTAQRLLILGTSNHRDNNFEKANEYYDQILSEELINNLVRRETEYYVAQSRAGLPIRTANDLYEEAMTAFGASPAWAAAQELKLYFPNDSRVSEAINTTAQRLSILGMNSHRKSDFDEANYYYGQIVAEELVNNTTRQHAIIYSNQAQMKKLLYTADDMYDEAMTAFGASPAWAAAQDLKTYFPNDPRVSEAINTTAQRLLILGTTSHREHKFEKASEYYRQMLDEELVNSSLREKTTVYYNQSSVKRALRTADDMYDEAMKAPGASPAWAAAQDLKTYFPNDPRVSEAINTTAQRLLILGTNSHRKKKFEETNYYYGQILDEQLVNNELRHNATIYFNQSKAKSPLYTADDMYENSVNAYGASDSWKIALELKETFPYSNRISEVINLAANRLFILGTTSHKKSDFSNAVYYYEQLLSEKLVDNNLQSLADKFLGPAKQRVKLRTASEYANDAKNAYGASDAWVIAVEGLTLYPNHASLISALNNAANRNLVLGRQEQRRGNIASARYYYQKVINEERVDESIKTLGTVFVKQLDSSHKPIVYLDPGHGGYDPGAVHGGVQEKLLNLNTARYLKAELESRGYIVMMSRNTDAFLELIEIANGANEVFADIFISVHYNSMGGSGAARGIETFIHHTVPSGFGQETNRNNFRTDDIRIKESLNLADSIHSNLIQSTGLYNRGVKGNNFSVLRNTDVPAVLLELGFMDNSTELARIRTASYQRTAAKAIAKGIDQYFNGFLN